MHKLNQRAVLNSLLQLVAAVSNKVLKHPRGLMLFVRITIIDDQKVQCGR
jgi:hypothetical protein